MTTRKQSTPKTPKPVQATPEETRAKVITEVVAILNERRRLLLESADHTLFHGRTLARVDECDEVQRLVKELLPGDAA